MHVGKCKHRVGIQLRTPHDVFVNLSDHFVRLTWPLEISSRIASYSELSILTVSSHSSIASTFTRLVKSIGHVL